MKIPARVRARKLIPQLSGSKMSRLSLTQASWWSCKIMGLVVAGLLLSLGVTFGQTEVVVDFEKAPITGRWIESWEEQGVVFTPAHAATRSQARPRLMFFPHLSSGRKGILSAMADDPIPVKARFPTGATQVTVQLWGSTGCPAVLEAFDLDGTLVDKVSVEAVPGRKSPGDPIPTFDMTVKGAHIASIQFSGPRVGEYLAADGVRFVPLPKESKLGEDR